MVDGSPDNSLEVCKQLAAAPGAPVTVLSLSRNFGEHNAVLTGWRHARGEYVVNLDDDGQNPPAEAVRMWRHAREQQLDVVFGHYAEKQHAAWRNRKNACRRSARPGACSPLSQLRAANQRDACPAPPRAPPCSAPPTPCC